MNQPSTFLAFRPTQWILALMGLLVILSTQGCGYSLGGTSNPIIWGQITHNGRPIKNGVIIFAPEVAETEKSRAESGDSDAEIKMDSMWAIAAIRSDGTYRLSLNARGVPMSAGWYRISVRPLDNPAMDLPEGEGSVIHGSPTKTNSQFSVHRSKWNDEDEEQKEDSKATKPPAKPLQSDIPVAYQEPTSSKLKLLIRAQPMQIDINLLD